MTPLSGFPRRLGRAWHTPQRAQYYNVVSNRMSQQYTLPPHFQDDFQRGGEFSTSQFHESSDDTSTNFNKYLQIFNLLFSRQHLRLLRILCGSFVVAFFISFLLSLNWSMMQDFPASWSTSSMVVTNSQQWTTRQAFKIPRFLRRVCRLLIGATLIIRPIPHS